MKCYSDISLKLGLAAFLLVITASTCVYAAANSSVTGNFGGNSSLSVQESLATKVIRFHVIANSDSSEDQLLKLDVKEAVVEYIYENTSGYTTLNDTRTFLSDNCLEIEKIAKSVIKENGYDYNVTACLTHSDFPEKSYGDVTFPAGIYETFTITIGNGEGHNWWCVLYPPLCFTDASTGVLPDSSKEMLKEELTEEEYNAITDNTGNDSDSASDDKTGSVTFRFKYFTFLNKLL